MFSFFCGIGLHATSLTFTLDLRPTDCQSSPPTPGTVEVFGSFNSNTTGGTFSNGPFTLVDPDGDNVWTYTLDHPNGGGTANVGTIYAQYRYRVGGVDESLSSVDNSGCAMATPIGREKFVGTSQTGATGNEYWETCSGTSCILPVELTLFKAENEAKGTVNLQWQTASEINNEGFDVEHSTDGRDFTKVDFINGYGTTNDSQNYSFAHNTPAAGKNYYRLKQMDYDGVFEYSKIVTVDIRKTGSNLSVYPSLVDDFVQVNFTADKEVEAIIQDQTGRTVLQQTIGANAGTARLETGDLPQGLYFLTVILDGQRESVRFVKK